MGRMQTQRPSSVDSTALSGFTTIANRSPQTFCKHFKLFELACSKIISLKYGRAFGRNSGSVCIANLPTLLLMSLVMSPQC